MLNNVGVSIRILVNTQLMSQLKVIAKKEKIIIIVIRIIIKM